MPILVDNGKHGMFGVGPMHDLNRSHALQKGLQDAERFFRESVKHVSHVEKERPQPMTRQGATSLTFCWAASGSGLR